MSAEIKGQVRFPRSRGDEPAALEIRELFGSFSPLTRG